MIKISKKGTYLNGPYGPYIKYNGPYSGPYAVPTVPTTETGRNELCALVTTAHLHCMRTGKCHPNLAYLGSGVCVKNAHHMFCVTSHVLCSPSSLSPPSPRYAELWNLILSLPPVLQHCEMGEGWGEGTAPTLLGRI